MAALAELAAVSGHAAAPRRSRFRRLAGVTRRSTRASRILRAVGARIPGLTGERLERAIRDAGNSLSALARDRRILAGALTWASLNWLLDAASLWCFVAAFGRMANPVELFAAYGIANMAGALPVTPAGLGVIDSLAPLLLVSFGMTRSVATLGVLGWRLVNFWLPIPAGAAAYASLKVPRGAGLKAMRAAVATLMTRGGPQHENQQAEPGHPETSRPSSEASSRLDSVRPPDPAESGAGTSVPRRWNHGLFGPDDLWLAATGQRPTAARPAGAMAGERRRPDGALPASWPLVAAELGIQADVIERPGEDGDRDRARSGAVR